MANFGKENRTSRLFFAYSGFSGCVICFCRLLCLFQHGLGKDAVAPGRVVDQHMGHRAHQPPVLQDGAAAHALHDAAGFGQECRIGHPQDHIPAGVGVVHLLDAHFVGPGRLALSGGPDLRFAGHHLLCKGQFPRFARQRGAQGAVDTVRSIDANAAQRMGAKEFSLQLSRTANGAAGAAHNAAGHDLAAAQGYAFAGVAVADRVAQPGKHPQLPVHKGHGAHPCGRIPHPHPGPPLGGRGVPHRGQAGLPLFPAADVHHLHRAALRRFQCLLHGVVVLGGRAAAAGKIKSATVSFIKNEMTEYINKHHGL